MHSPRFKPAVHRLRGGDARRSGFPSASRAEPSSGEKVEPLRQLVFRSIDDLRSFLTPQRLRLLKLIRSRRPGSVYELAALAGRDRKAVRTDLDVLVSLGVVRMSRASTGGRVRSVPHVPYSRIEIGVKV